MGHWELVLPGDCSRQVSFLQFCTISRRGLYPHRNTCVRSRRGRYRLRNCWTSHLFIDPAHSLPQFLSNCIYSLFFAFAGIVGAYVNAEEIKRSRTLHQKKFEQEMMQLLQKKDGGVRDDTLDARPSGQSLPESSAGDFIMDDGLIHRDTKEHKRLFQREDWTGQVFENERQG